MPQVQAGPLTLAGVRATFYRTYEPAAAASVSELKDVMDVDMPSDKLTEIYGYSTSAPHPGIWRRGEGIPTATFDSIGFTCSNLDWGLKVPIHKNDRIDDQTGTVMKRVRDAATNFALLKKRVFFQILTSATNAQLLQSIPLAPDGNALFATSRFGLADGNLLTGNGVSSVAQLQRDYLLMLQQWLLMQDTQGIALWPEDILDQGVIIYYGAQNMEIFDKAFLQTRNEGLNATPSNSIQDAGRRPILRPTSYITNDDWFGFLKAAPTKPIFHQKLQGLEEHVSTMDNSDTAKDTKEESIQWDSRDGYGVNEAFGAICINN